MTKLSVNVNKVATVRNARGGLEPDVADAARLCLQAGAGGVTVHPRPDGRHIRYEDVRRLAELLKEFPGAELNVEGYPSLAFLGLVLEVRPTQCTIVPDPPDALTSSFGWDVVRHADELARVVRVLERHDVRSSLFMDPVVDQIAAAAAIGADRIELYTEPFARAVGTPSQASVLSRYVAAAQNAGELGLGVNAGHDLSLANLGLFCEVVPGVLEVSIGHALISHALEVGLATAVREYLAVLDQTAKAA
jgi:pyridoxine 5-phosphate synthase